MSPSDTSDTGKDDVGKSDFLCGNLSQFSRIFLPVYEMTYVHRLNTATFLTPVCDFLWDMQWKTTKDHITWSMSGVTAAARYLVVR